MCFLSNRTNFVETDKLSAGYSWLHQVLKKMFSIVRLMLKSYFVADIKPL